MSSSFVKGLELSRRFFREVVKGIIKQYFPSLKYDAALLGPGSEVLGFDDQTSTDHHWGPRVQLFLTELDYMKYSDEIKAELSKNLPYMFLGYSTNWSEPEFEDRHRIPVQFLIPITSGPINHRVETYCLTSYLKDHLDINSINLSESEWLVLSEQKLLEFTSGEIFWNKLGELSQARRALSYFPNNVWIFKLLAEWDHIAEEIAFVGRVGSIGDDLGSQIEATRLVEHIIQLTFLLHKKYMPYPKWRTIAFSQLPTGKELKPILVKILKESNWRNKERFLCDAYLKLLLKQNSLQITPKITIKPDKFHSRDQLVINVNKITNELRKLLKPPLTKIKYPTGSIDHFIDDTHILTDLKFAKKIQTLFK
ncbi:MAG: DUF4037 domain-containing protein [Promethearchaeota archaeon]